MTCGHERFLTHRSAMGFDSRQVQYPGCSIAMPVPYPTMEWGQGTRDARSAINFQDEFHPKSLPGVILFGSFLAWNAPHT